MQTDIRIGIIHRVRAVKEGLAASLQLEPGITVVALPEDSSHSHQDDPSATVDLVLVAAASEFEALEKRVQDARRRSNNPKVIVFGVTNSRDGILACIEAGASAFTLSNASICEIVDVIRSVHSGGMVCSPEVSSYLFDRLASLKREQATSQPAMLNQFTRREAQILQLLSDGLSNKEIGSTLGLELQTVKNYVHNILEKLRVRNRSAAASYARRTGLVETAPPL